MDFLPNFEHKKKICLYFSSTLPYPDTQILVVWTVTNSANIDLGPTTKM